MYSAGDYIRSFAALRMTTRVLCPVRSVELQSEPLRWRLRVALRRPSQPVDSFLVGTWLSLVEHSLGVRGVGSSNLPVPTTIFSIFQLTGRATIGAGRSACPKTN